MNPELARLFNNWISFIEAPISGKASMENIGKSLELRDLTKTHIVALVAAMEAISALNDEEAKMVLNSANAAMRNAATLKS